MSNDFPHAGTVISGTLRSQDLIPALLGKLRELAPDRAEEIERNYPVTLTAPEEDFMLASDALIENLMDELGDLAPEGWRFGSLEGDGADFGFWRDQEDDDTPESMRPGFQSFGLLGRWSNHG